MKKKIPVLIVCNKTDKVTAHTKEFIRKQMEKEMYGFLVLLYQIVHSWLHLLHILQAVYGIKLLVLPPFAMICSTLFIDEEEIFLLYVRKCCISILDCHPWITAKVVVQCNIFCVSFILSSLDGALYVCKILMTCMH